MLIDTHREWVEDALKAEDVQRQGYWTENLAVKSREYVRWVQETMGITALKRQIVGDELGYAIREPLGAYRVVFDTEIGGLSRVHASPVPSGTVRSMR
jgi:hypothetical protein